MKFKRIVLVLISNILITACVSSLITYGFFKKMDNLQKQQLEYVNQIEEELKSMQEKGNLLQNESIKLENQLGDLQSELETLKSALDQKQVDIEKLEEQIVLLEARLDNLRGEEPEFTEAAPIYTRNKN